MTTRDGDDETAADAVGDFLAEALGAFNHT
jgi:hypothetical protein